MMEYVGLIFEILILVAGIYVYLFAIGKLKAKDQNRQKKAEAFRKENQVWLKYSSLLLVAIMLIEIVMHIKALM